MKRRKSLQGNFLQEFNPRISFLFTDNDILPLIDMMTKIASNFLGLILT